MQLVFGSRVRNANGDELGDLHRLVCTENVQRVNSLVVEHGDPTKGDVLVPFSVVELADDESVQVSLGAEQYDQLGPYDTGTINIAPPPVNDEGDENIVEGRVDIPDVPPVGAATGVESIAFTPILDEHTAATDAEVVLEAGTRVRATDGDVGRIRGIWLDDIDLSITGISIQAGGFFSHQADVSIDQLDCIDDDGLLLRVAQSELTSVDDR